MATVVNTATYNGRVIGLIASTDAVTGDHLNINTIVVSNLGAGVQNCLLVDDDSFTFFNGDIPIDTTVAISCPGKGLRVLGVTATLGADINVFIYLN